MGCEYVLMNSSKPITTPPPHTHTHTNTHTHTHTPFPPAENKTAKQKSTQQIHGSHATNNNNKILKLKLCKKNKTKSRTKG